MAQILFSTVNSSSAPVIAAFTGLNFPDRVKCGDVITNGGGLFVRIEGLTFIRAMSGDDWDAIVTLELI